MTTPDLIAYIQAQVQKNTPIDIIKSRLTQVGWNAEDIEEGFLKIILPRHDPISDRKIVSEPVTVAPATQPIVDKYKELINDDTSESIVSSSTVFPRVQELVKSEPPKVWTPKQVTPIVQSVAVQPLIDIPREEPVTVAVIPQNLEVSAPIIPLQPVVTPVTPVSISNTSIPSDFVSSNMTSDTSENLPTVFLSELEKSKSSSDSVIYLIPKPSSDKEGVKTETPKEISPVADTSLVETPTLIPLQTPLSQPVVPIEIPKIQTSSPSMELPKSALLSSYGSDVSKTLGNEDAHVLPTQKSSILKWLIVILIILILGGGVFAFIKGYIRLPNIVLGDINLSIIKKDPKEVLLATSLELTRTTSYKTETDISISVPSFADITAGLVTGEAVDSKERDSIALHAMGSVSKSDISLPTFQYVIDMKTSLLNDKISSVMTSDGAAYYIHVPDLKEVLQEEAPKTGPVFIKYDELSTIIEALPVSLRDVVTKIDTHKILSNGVSPYMKNQIYAVFKEFISNTSIDEKGSERIHGVNTYHYRISADRETVKKFLSLLVEISGASITDQSRADLEEALGSLSIDSFDVWIGKNDGKLYQYKVALTIPLSQVIGFTDKGIAGNEVHIDIERSYYDFDVPVSITIPEQAVSLPDFITSVRDNQIKNTITSFGSSARMLLNAEGRYGSRSNTKGSCIEPVYGSLFSPLGHPKGANAPIGAIAQSMNTLLEMTKNTASCYSTPNAWAISAPLASNRQSFLCRDSTGTSMTLSSPLTGPVCK